MLGNNRPLLLSSLGGGGGGGRGRGLVLLRVLQDMFKGFSGVEGSLAFSGFEVA